MHIRDNTFCWHAISTDPVAGAAFYRSVLGWTLVPDGEGPSLFVGPGGAVGHLQPAGEAPAGWCSYLSVDDLDARTDAAIAAGGALVVPPTDLPAGRFSIVTTPTGAVFGLYQAAPADELAAPGPGSIHWVELQSTAAGSDAAWLGSVFGFDHRLENMAMGPYRILEASGEPRGGVVSGEAATFVAWVQVADLDATLADVVAHGGTVITGAFGDPAVGRMAIVADPTGASFGLVQPV